MARLPPNPSTPSIAGDGGDQSPARQRAGDWKDLEDGELVEACVGNDPDAWEELINRYSRLVYSIPRRMGLDRAASEDIFQDVFSVLVRQLPEMRRRTALPKWLITTTHRISRHSCRQARRWAENHHVQAEQVTPPLEQVQQWERQHLVRQALRRLGGRGEQLLTALYAKGPVSYQEVARQLNMPAGSIGPTRARCLQKLLELLDGMG